MTWLEDVEGQIFDTENWTLVVLYVKNAQALLESNEYIDLLLNVGEEEKALPPQVINISTRLQQPSII